MYHRNATRIVRTLIICFLTLALAAQLHAADADDSSFDKALEKHLAAVRDKNFDNLVATLPDKGELILILPSGQKSDTAEAYKTMHKSWFAQSGWTMKHEVLKKHRSQGMGYALVKSDYHEADRGGKPYHNQLFVSLIFRRTEKGWVLVFDQCTKIPAEPSKG
ncbi:Nuclear transport factor 2 family protein [Sulfidibacter corallicola]|uniref:Nuclear transport factor 2 family protein n=1 Tax=Sulfidibacter corallicola TaxID=2818388 RepID=A0A8A4TRE9_SULCO|nr:nuclear transport factor 2 family protein [Sulfidibacter corallicola]QTD51662.1 nuclear transport factor 2 family protein [Sulfidibacter corallicola]